MADGASAVQALAMKETQTEVKNELAGDFNPQSIESMT
jgi:hypothetical protein